MPGSRLFAAVREFVCEFFHSWLAPTLKPLRLLVLEYRSERLFIGLLMALHDGHDFSTWVPLQSIQPGQHATHTSLRNVILAAIIM